MRLISPSLPPSVLGSLALQPKAESCRLASEGEWEHSWSPCSWAGFKVAKTSPSSLEAPSPIGLSRPCVEGQGLAALVGSLSRGHLSSWLMKLPWWAASPPRERASLEGDICRREEHLMAQVVDFGTGFCCLCASRCFVTKLRKHLQQDFG